MATTTKKTSGIILSCPHCGARHDDSTRGLCIEVGNMNLHCSECSEDVTREDLERVRGDVDRLLRLLDMAASV